MGNVNEKQLAEATDNYIETIEKAFKLGDATFRQFKEKNEQLVSDVEDWLKEEKEKIKKQVSQTLKVKDSSEAAKKCIEGNSTKMIDTLENLRNELKQCKDDNQYEMDQLQIIFKKFIKEGRTRGTLVLAHLNKCLERSPEYREEAQLCIEQFTIHAATAAKELAAEMEKVTGRLNILYAEYERCSNPPLRKAKQNLARLEKALRDCKNLE